MSSQIPNPDFNSYDWAVVSLFFSILSPFLFYLFSSVSFSSFLLLPTNLIDQGGPAPGVGMGITSISLCPTAHPTYTLGTYAIGVYSNSPTSYRIDIESASEVDFPFHFLFFF